jgi:hypothetical protein
MWLLLQCGFGCPKLAQDAKEMAQNLGVISVRPESLGDCS